MMSMLILSYIVGFLNGGPSMISILWMHMAVEDFLGPWLSLYQRKPHVSIDDFIMYETLKKNVLGWLCY